jgi:AAA domain
MSPNTKRSAKRRRSRPANNDKPRTLNERLLTTQAGAQPDDDESTWAPVDLGPALRGEQTADPPAILPRTDDICLLYAGKVHSIYGEPESGKTWLALLGTASELLAGHCVAYIDFEDDAATAVERLRALGVPGEAIEDRLIYIRPDERLDQAGWAELADALDVEDLTFVVFDGMTEALALENVDIIDNTRVAKWIVEVPKRIARETRATVVLIDHVTKDGDSRGPIGAQHKLAGITAAYLVKRAKPFGRGLNGSSRIKIEKDRPGHVRRHATKDEIAELKFKSDLATGAVTMELKPGSEFLYTDKMEAVSVFLEDQAPEPMNETKILDRVGGKEQIVKSACRALADRGYIRIDPQGVGKPTLHYLIEPYRAPVEDDE